MTRDAAETLALEALGEIASDADLLSRFLTATGLAPDELRARASDPHLLAGVLDFLMADEAAAAAFCGARRLKPETLQRLRAALPGGEPSWT